MDGGAQLKQEKTYRELEIFLVACTEVFYSRCVDQIKWRGVLECIWGPQYSLWHTSSQLSPGYGASHVLKYHYILRKVSQDGSSLVLSLRYYKICRLDSVLSFRLASYSIRLSKRNIMGGQTSEKSYFIYSGAWPYRPSDTMDFIYL